MSDQNQAREITLPEKKKAVVLDDTQYRYTPDAGTVEGPVHCGVCGCKMDEKLACFGPRGFAEAMSYHHSEGKRGGSKYDSFNCPHGDEMWHKQAVKLRSMARETPSKKLEEIFREEANQIVGTKKATKEGYWFV